MPSVRGQAYVASGGDVRFLAECGSGLHGIAIEGQDDHDELGFFIEKPHDMFGFKHQETVVKRSKPEGVRSEPGDTDITLHCLRKFVKLLVGGNPTVLQMLFVPDDKLYVTTPVYERMRELSDTLVTKRTAKAFLGYLGERRARLVGERGQKGVRRQDLIDRYGYDTKYAAHALRLGLQGVEFITSGKITLPMSGREALAVRAVRNGDVKLSVALDAICDAEKHLLRFLSTGLPRTPDAAPWEELLVETYLDTYRRECYRR